METAAENEKTARNNLEQGLIQNADYLNVQVRLGEVENQLLAARSQAENVSEYLSVLLEMERIPISPQNLIFYLSDQESSSGHSTEQ